MTINKLLHNSATHAEGLDESCPVCNQQAKDSLLETHPNAWQGISGSVHSQRSAHWYEGPNWVVALRNVRKREGISK